MLLGDALMGKMPMPRLLNPDSEVDLNLLARSNDFPEANRPEGPPVSRPDRKVGREDHPMMSAEGAAQRDSLFSAGPSGLDSLPNRHPELTLGSTRCRRFAPQGRPTSESGLNYWSRNY